MKTLGKDTVALPRSLEEKKLQDHTSTSLGSAEKSSIFAGVVIYVKRLSRQSRLFLIYVPLILKQMN